MPTEKDIFVNEINAYAKKYGISKIMTKKEVLAIAGLSKNQILVRQTIAIIVLMMV